MVAVGGYSRAEAGQAVWLGGGTGVAGRVRASSQFPSSWLWFIEHGNRPDGCLLLIQRLGCVPPNSLGPARTTVVMLRQWNEATA